MTNPSLKINLEESWKKVLEEEFHKEYMLKLKAFLQSEIQKGKIIYPHGNEIFSALNLTPFSNIKVVIIGQDPYHGPGQAHGLCFSVRPRVPPPPSLQNIFKELQVDLAIPRPEHGHLTSWAKQGVLLLNAILTVEKGRPLSHQNQGWEQFTDRIVQILNEKKEGLIFVLWGSPAQKKGSILNSKKHLILKAPHPSPLSAHRGFLGCRHFSKINNFLKANHQEEIEWQLPPLSYYATREPTHASP